MSVFLFFHHLLLLWMFTFKKLYKTFLCALLVHYSKVHSIYSLLITILTDIHDISIRRSLKSVISIDDWTKRVLWYDRDMMIGLWLVWLKSVCQIESRSVIVMISLKIWSIWVFLCENWNVIDIFFLIHLSYPVSC